MADKPTPITEYESRLTGEYIANQVTQYRKAERHSEHKTRIADGDALYRGDLSKFYPAGERAPDHIRVENKYKNALHDIVRLAAEPKPSAVFMQQGDSMTAAKQARIRANIVDTYWDMNRGPALSRKWYMDLAGTGYCATAWYWNSKSDYPQTMRLDPRYCYPDVRNGGLVSMLYVESVKAAVAKQQWPKLAPALGSIKNDTDVMIAVYYDEVEAVTAVVKATGKKPEGWIVDGWRHELGCVPVAFEAMDTFDGTFRGIFDQVGGPLAFRDRMMGYLDDYMEDMVHSPFEAKGILNPDTPPGPLTIYEHDPGAEESFMRRVAPAAPAGTVFGLLQYAGEQEATEALQPPARVGQVRQSIASGDFVNSTQGALSSAVRELQDHMSSFRYQCDYIAMKIDEKYLNFEKPMMRSIGSKKTYTPSEDIAGVYWHRIIYGASAGLDRQYADVRVMQHVGNRLISRQMGREQLEYVDDPFTAQEQIYQEQMADVLFQRFVADPATPISEVADALVQMSKGKDLVEVMQQQAAEMKRREEEALAAQQGAQLPQGEAPAEPGEEALAADKGAVEEPGPDFEQISLGTPPPLSQLFVTSGR